MGFLNFGRSRTPSQSQIIYTDNVRRKSSFSLIVSDSENKDIDFEEISKHIATFEENASNENEIGNVIIDKNGNFMVVTELGANFIFKESDDVRGQKIQVSATHKWLVFVSAFFILMVDLGFVFNFGTLFPTVLEEFGDSRASTAAIQSIFTGIGPSLGIVTGAVAQKFGPRNCGVIGGIFFCVGLIVSVFATSTIYLQLSYGILSALGFSLLYICPNQIITQLFEGQARFICLSLISLAPSVGGLAFPYLLMWLSDMFGLSGTFLLLGGLSLNTIPLAALWNIPCKPKKGKHSKDKNATEQTEQSYKRNTFLRSIYETLKYKPFLFLMLGVGFSLSTINIHGILAMDILDTNGLSPDESITAIIVTNAASIAARLIPALTNKIRGYSTILTPTLASLVGSSGMLLFIFVPNFVGGVIASAIIGLSRGCLVTSMAIVTIKLLDVTRFSTGLGLTFGLVGLITTVTGPLYGFLRDISGSYTIPLYATTTALLAGCLFCSVSLVLHSHAKAQKKRERSMSVFTVTRF